MVPSAPYGYTFDTCAIINVWRNPNISTPLRMLLETEGSIVYMNSYVVGELAVKSLGQDEAGRMLHEHLGADAGADVISTMRERAGSMLQKRLGADVSGGDVIPKMREHAVQMEEHCPTLHSPDSIILAFAMYTKTVLVTHDKGLLAATEKMKAPCVDPNVIVGDCSAKRRRNQFEGLVGYMGSARLGFD
ncbi:hypothetical protein CENSYa_0464 [Cenarchaeum symbiosum A]|uniref:PIN domain-containing protein n=1 Tax=Cenarchaeum symbiosum (strain A) TaxID=414004 RepID=A0RUT1_CENSY|nr:hypothetical protein CENSYa_0464 [Cenarchaeum symbiosum A]